MVPARAPVSLSEVIGRNIRRLRETRQEASQDEAAMLLRSFGLDWNRSQLAKAERGERGFNIEQLVLIASALDATVAELVELEEGELVALSEDATVDGVFLAASLKGHRYVAGEATVALPHLDVPQTRWWREHAELAIGEWKQTWGRPPTDAEQRLASVLNTTFEVVNATGLQLWGKSFLDERDERVELAQRANPEASVTALRGHATRALITELRPQVERRAKRRKR